ncbi:MAG: DUF5667 domain-containing protein [Candidatus Nanoarchaeia archaeon]
MKTFFSLMGLVFAFLALLTAVGAQNISENVSKNISENISVPMTNESIEQELSVDPGMTPESPLWGIDVALDKLAFRLASGPKKAELGLKIARERLAEIKRLHEHNKTKLIEKVLNEHDKILVETNETIAKFDNVSAKNETMLGIERGMANHIAALQKVEEKIVANPNMPAEVKAKLVQKIDTLIEKAEAVETKVVQKRVEVEYRERIEKISCQKDEDCPQPKCPPEVICAAKCINGKCEQTMTPITPPIPKEQEVHKQKNQTERENKTKTEE